MKEMGGWVDGWMDHLFLRLDENSISPREGGRGEGGAGLSLNAIKIIRGFSSGSYLLLEKETREIGRSGER